MTDRQKMMCRCDTCIIFDDIQCYLNLFWKHYISSLKKAIKDIINGPSHVNAKKELQCYIQGVCKDPLGDIPKHASGWQAACKLACPPVDINGKTYSSMQCALKLCPNCVDKWNYPVPDREMNCSEQISYVAFGTHSKCIYHGDMDM